MPGRGPRLPACSPFFECGFQESSAHRCHDLRQSSQAEAVLKSSLVNDNLRTVVRDRAAAIATLHAHFGDADVGRKSALRYFSQGRRLYPRFSPPSSQRARDHSQQVRLWRQTQAQSCNATGRGTIRTTPANHSVEVVPTGSGREANSTL
jgi:hypothetical protein